MDPGIYATTQVTSCATVSSSCWSVYGTGLPNAPVVALQASAGVATGDGRNGELRAATYGRGIWQIPLLTRRVRSYRDDAKPHQPDLRGAGSIDCKRGADHYSDELRQRVAHHHGKSRRPETSTRHGNCIGPAIAVGATCAVQVEFQPTTTGTRTGVLTIYGNVAGGQATAALTGVGTTAATVLLDPITLSFTSTNVGATSAQQFITISNTGGM